MPTYPGIVQGNVVLLPDDIRLPDGVAVQVQVPGSDTEPSSQVDPEAAFLQRLLELGLLSETRTLDRTQDDRDRVLIEVEGKPLSEMIIDERR